jgi:hypothetical protein
MRVEKKGKRRAGETERPRGTTGSRETSVPSRKNNDKQDRKRHDKARCSNRNF